MYSFEGLLSSFYRAFKSEETPEEIVFRGKDIRPLAEVLRLGVSSGQENEELQRQYMPRRYWGNLIEVD